MAKSLYMRSIFKVCLIGVIAYMVFACEPQKPSSVPANYFAHIQLDSTVLIATEIAQGLSVPWDLEFGPDGWIWFTEQKGSVSRINPQSGERIEIFQIDSLFFRKSSGLFSMALHPDFNNQPFVYLHYMVSEKDANFIDQVSSKLVRYRYDQDILSSPKILLENIPGNTYHNGSRILVQGKTLFLCLGDAGKTDQTQNSKTYHGKILRINLDGTIPEDNPFPDSPVWSTGHRNIQGITAANDNLYVSEHGPASDDEINRIVKKGNYGWPDIEGVANLENEIQYATDSMTVDPIKTWTPTIAPSGLAYYDHENIPEWRNNLLLTNLKGQSIRLLQLNNEGSTIVSEKIFLQKVLGRMRDVIVDNDGAIYLSTSNTDWHPATQPGMYDSLPVQNGDRIIKLEKAGAQLQRRLTSFDRAVLLKENPTPLKLEAETYDFKPSNENLANGNRLYQQFCAACHRTNGAGNIGHIPPLITNEWVTGNRARLIDVTLGGLNAPITVNGVHYEGEMPSYAYLKDDEIRDILNFVRTEFGKVKGTIISEDVRHQRKGL